MNKIKEILRQKAKNGFTLIELLVVISIIGILMGLLLVAYQGTRQSARDGKRKADLEQIRTALEMYRSDKGYYPPQNDPGGWCTVLKNCIDNIGWYNDVAGALITGGYLSSLPQDPLYTGEDSYDYFYYKVSNSQYELFSSLELDNNNNYDPREGVTCACESRFDYKVTSP